MVAEEEEVVVVLLLKHLKRLVEFVVGLDFG
jgi:hypothetical protein